MTFVTLWVKYAVICYIAIGIINPSKASGVVPRSQCHLIHHVEQKTDRYGSVSVESWWGPERTCDHWDHKRGLNSRHRTAR